MTMTSTKSVRGEDLEVSERVILAPAVGVFQPVAGEDGNAAGNGERSVMEGEVVGVVESRGKAIPVHSAFSGFLMGMLAHPGERVREGQPVAWLRIL
jgi:hypothetical protein